MPKLMIKKLHPEAKMPVKAHSTDAGYDVYFDNLQAVYAHGGGNGEVKLEGQKLSKRCENEVLTLSYLERALCGTGIAIAVPEGYEVQVRPRSGLALKQGFEVVNSPGTIDPGYRDEVRIILKNGSRADQSIKLGDRIAQLVFKKLDDHEIELVDNLPIPSERGMAGFGSTGK